MADDMRIDCQVDVPIEVQGGNFADAFRITPLKSDECLLDFMSISQCRTKASVVARIRVENKFLASIRDRLESTLEEIDGQFYGILTPKQIEEMWFLVDHFPIDDDQDDQVLPLIWYANPPGKVD